MARASTENILHFNGVRLRVVGSGNLKLTMHSLDEVVNQDLLSITMQATTNREPFRLANFSQQRIRLELKTTEIDETFRITKIILFVKPLAAEYPG